MKEVFCAYDVRATREVALAKPLASLTSDVYDAFLREAHITARLEHPGIINLFDMGIARDGRPFFTMELKRGRSLREILKELIAGKGDEDKGGPIAAVDEDVDTGLLVFFGEDHQL